MGEREGGQSDGEGSEGDRVGSLHGASVCWFQFRQSTNLFTLSLVPRPFEAHVSEHGEETFLPCGKGLGTRLVHTAMFVSHPKE